MSAYGRLWQRHEDIRARLAKQYCVAINETADFDTEIARLDREHRARIADLRSARELWIRIQAEMDACPDGAIVSRRSR